MCTLVVVALLLSRVGLWRRPLTSRRWSFRQHSDEMMVMRQGRSPCYCIWEWVGMAQIKVEVEKDDGDWDKWQREMKESLEDPLAIHLLLKFFNIYSPRRVCRLLFSSLPVPLLVMVAWVDKDIQTADGG